MNKYENGVIKYQISFERYKNGQANEILTLLDKADSEIAKYIRKTDGIYTKARYKEIATSLREISKSLKQQVGDNIDVDGVIDYELNKQKKLLSLMKSDIKKALSKNADFLFPTKEQIRTAALFKPATDGLTYESYLNGIEAGLFNSWDCAVRTGYLTGQTTKEIVRNVIGGLSPATRIQQAGQIQSLRNSIYGNTKTLIQSFAEETREQVYRENEQYFGDGESEYKYEYLATLDSHTCIMCGELDGRLYTSLNEAPSIPQHRGCRCLLIPYFKIYGDKRSSKTGYIDSNVTFENWLKEQKPKIQKDVLGKTRYELFKSGTPMKTFVDNGRILTLEQLEKILDE